MGTPLQEFRSRAEDISVSVVYPLEATGFETHMRALHTCAIVRK